MLLRTHRTAPHSGLRASRTGFTLLEVLVVVAIIVMLAGVGGYMVLGQYKSSLDKKARIDAMGLSSLVDQFTLNNNGNPPDQLIELVGAGLCTEDKLVDPWRKPFTYDKAGTLNGGAKPDVYTTSDATNKIIGNHPGSQVQ